MIEITVYINLFFENNIQNISSKNRIRNNLINHINLSENIFKVNNDKIVLLFRYEFFEWEKFVFELLSLSQKIGYAWVISGSIRFDYSAFSNQAKISGIKSINVECRNPIYN